MVDLKRSDTREFWEQYLTEHPEAMFRLLADLYEHIHGAKARPSSLQDLWDLVTPRFATVPFGEALTELLKGRSYAWLAAQTHVSKVYISRLVNGRRADSGKVSVINYADLDGAMAFLRDVASALDVHPSYFAEWRYMWLISMFERAFESEPHLSIPIFRKFAELPATKAS